MVITYHGGECFKVSFGDTTLAFNPISKKAKKLKPARFGADIALVTTQHDDFNGIESVSQGGASPFLITGPGEYEVKDVIVKGFQSTTQYDGAILNTIYLVTLEHMNLLFLGALSDRELPQQLREEIESVDAVFVPIGGDGVLDAAGAHKVAVSVEPHMVIPMHYGDIGEKDALKTFLKEEGVEQEKPQEKLTIKRKDLDGKSGEIAVLGA